MSNLVLEYLSTQYNKKYKAGVASKYKYKPAQTNKFNNLFIRVSILIPTYHQYLLLSFFIVVTRPNFLRHTIE